MAWVAPPTFVAGAFLTAAQMNILGGDLSFLAGSTGVQVAAAQTTASTTYTDLATVGPAVTLTTGSSAIVSVSAFVSNNTANDTSIMSFAVSGATTLAAADATALSMEAYTGGAGDQRGYTSFITGLNAGSNTFTAKYRVTAGTGTFGTRWIVVIPLP